MSGSFGTSTRTSKRAVAQPVLDGIVARAVDASFNCITVDGDTSTNDACVLVATGQAGAPPTASHDDPAAALHVMEDASASVRGPLETCPGCRITFAVPAAIAAARAGELSTHGIQQ